MKKGFCTVVTMEEIAEQDYILTSGRYVGLTEQEDDGELSELFEKSHEWEAEIKKRLGVIGYELQRFRL